MATIPRPQLFGWDSVDSLGDLERLQLVLGALPDESLMQLLEADRRAGRNDYPRNWCSGRCGRCGTP